MAIAGAQWRLRSGANVEIEGEDNLHQLRPQNNLHRSRRKYNLHQLRPQDKGRARLPKRMNFRKTSKRGEGGVIFNPKIYVAHIGNFTQLNSIYSMLLKS